MPGKTAWGPPAVARGGDVIAFPAGGRARTRTGLEQVRFHTALLDRELQDLAGRKFRSAGEWARSAATPIVRTDCIMNFLMRATVTQHLVVVEEFRDQGCVGRVCDEFRWALSDTAMSLARLGDPWAGPTERYEVLRELPSHRIRHERILERLHERVDESHRHDVLGSS